MPDAALLAAEVKLGCTLGMLLCLDRDQRLAYVLTDVFDLPSVEAAFVCGTTPAAVRKRAAGLDPGSGPSSQSIVGW